MNTNKLYYVRGQKNKIRFNTYVPQIDTKHAKSYIPPGFRSNGIKE